MTKALSPPLPPDVAAAIAKYPPRVRKKLRELRALIYETAGRSAGVGPLTETLKWGEAAYLTEATGNGGTIRLGWIATPRPRAWRRGRSAVRPNPNR